MMEIKGQVNTAVCFAKVIEDEAIMADLEAQNIDTATAQKMQYAATIFGARGLSGITMTNDGMSHELTYSFEGVTGTIGTTTSSSYTWAVPVSLAGQIPAATSGTCRITCTSDASF